MQLQTTGLDAGYCWAMPLPLAGVELCVCLAAHCCTQIAVDLAQASPGGQVACLWSSGYARIHQMMAQASVALTSKGNVVREVRRGVVGDVAPVFWPQVSFGRHITA